MCPFPAQPDRQREHRGRYRPVGSNYISVPQATNLIEAVNFAKSIGLPLVAHLTIHWSGTVAFDDPDGTRFAKVREGLAKVLLRRGIPPRGSGAASAKPTPTSCIAICSFILPIDYRTGPKLDEHQGRHRATGCSPR